MLHDGVAHDPLTCARDATVELPKNSFMFAPAFASRIRNGSIALTFNQKTNKVVLTFNRQKLSDVLNKEGLLSTVQCRCMYTRALFAVVTWHNTV